MTRRILIVDDDTDILEIARISFETTGAWTVLTATDGASGEALARTARPDVILLDHMMPIQDGATTLDHLKGDPTTAPIPVIILTAKTQRGLADDLERRGARAVLEKPFDPIGLPDTIARVLEAQP